MKVILVALVKGLAFGGENMSWYMQWWVVGTGAGLVAGAIIFRRDIVAGFRRGLQVGFGTWVGTSTIPVVVCLGVMFAVQSCVGK